MTGEIPHPADAGFGMTGSFFGRGESWEAVRSANRLPALPFTQGILSFRTEPPPGGGVRNLPHAVQILVS